MGSKTPVLKLNRPLACKPPAAIVSELTQVARVPFTNPRSQDFAIGRQSE